MTPEQFRRIDEVVETLLECRPDERQAVIDDRCGDDADLRHAVLALLRQEEGLDSFLVGPGPWQAGLMGEEAADSDAASERPTTDFDASETTPRRPVAGVAGRLDEVTAGERIGPYRILGLLGHGGMGSVYRAERDDDVFRGEVAIKLLRPGLRSEDLLRRFRAEIQILAGLRHPNISRLLDGGTYRDDRPYVVLELVDGVPIDQFCDQHDLDTDQRLELFEQVCAGVELAHRNLVVHRDIKPANLLVTADGRPVLLDFGIAKVLDSESFPHTLQDTASHLRPMTPSYASPEQFFGQPVTTSSDVYSLGVLLYLLLCGRLPHDLRGKSPLEVERLLRDASPPPPSTVVAEDETAPDTSRRRRNQDLDSIALMALRFEPERRYGSVEQLRLDVQRYRRGLPVVARGTSRIYRLAKLTRKYWLASLTLVTVIVLLSTLAVTMSLSANRLDKQRLAAETERDKAQTVAQLMVDMFAYADPVEGASTELTVRESLDHSLPLIRHRIADQPEVQASLLQSIGQVYHGLGSLDSAEDVLVEALKIQRELTGDEHFDVTQTLTDLALLYGDRGEPEKALATHREALALREKLLGADHLEVALTLQNMAVEAGELRRYAEAEGYISRSLAIREAQLQPDHFRIGISSQILGNFLAVRSRFDEAAVHHERALDIAEKRFGPVHINVSYAVHAIGESLLQQQETTETQAMIGRVAAIREQLLGPDHLRLVPALINLGLNEMHRGAMVDARAFLDRAGAIAEANSAPDGLELGNVELIRGFVATRRGDAERALGHLTRSREIFDLHLGPDNHPPFWVFAQAENDLLRGEPAAARDRLRRLLTRLDEQSLDETLEGAHALRLTGVADRALGDLDAARRNGKACLAILERLDLPEMILAIDARLDLATLGLRQEQWDVAASDFEIALQHAESRLARNADPTSRRLQARALRGLGRVAVAQGEADRASAYVARAADTLGAPGSWSGRDVLFLATWVDVFEASGRPDDARPAAEELARRGGSGSLATTDPA